MDFEPSLVDQIRNWNSNRLDLFEINLPDSNGIYYGVIRFFFQDTGAKVSTKCIRVASNVTSKEIIEMLIEKFRPDMRMLSSSSDYCLYEVHAGEERRLTDSDYPLVVQLNWGKDDREGRFLLKLANEKTIRVDSDGVPIPAALDRKLSKREQKEKKKRDKEKQKSGGKPNGSAIEADIYNALPETSFTRTISNPEMVMKRRRQLKLEQKLQQEGPTAVGTLKIYGDTLQPGEPYKTLLLSTADNAAFVIKETLEKYGMEKEDVNEFCLVEVHIPRSEAGQQRQSVAVPREQLLSEKECPWALFNQSFSPTNEVQFHIRRRARKRGQMPGNKSSKGKIDAHSNSSHGSQPHQHLPPLQHMQQNDRNFVTPNHSIDITHQNSQINTPQNISNTDYSRQSSNNAPYAGPSPQHAQVQQAGFSYNNNTISSNSHLSASGAFGSTDNLIDGIGRDTDIDQRSLDRQLSVDEVLPASLIYAPELEPRLLQAFLSVPVPDMLQFKLAPAYCVYLAARYRISPSFIPEWTQKERRSEAAKFLNHICDLITSVVDQCRNDVVRLAFWLANSSELLHFFKYDHSLCELHEAAIDKLSRTVEVAFDVVVISMKRDIEPVLVAFLADDDNSNQQFNMDTVLNALTSIMSLLRRCRVNAALTIQLFSNLFHHINQWLFNQLIRPGNSFQEGFNVFCSRSWAHRLKMRLEQIERWAEKQGLELAADCHLARVQQASHLLQAPKHSLNDIAALTSSCYCLNSLQVRTLLQNYLPDQDEPYIDPELAQKLISAAVARADNRLKEENLPITVEEDRDLRIPFSLPEDGYSCDIVREMPQGLSDFLAPLSQPSGMCRLMLNSEASGLWNVYLSERTSRKNSPMRTPQMQLSPAARRIDPVMLGLPPSPAIVIVDLGKLRGSMGLSIVAAKGDNQDKRGTYIKSVVPGGAAEKDGRLAPGDQILSVDGNDITGLTQENSALVMQKTGQVVRLKIAKQAAIYHNLSALLSDPSPSLSRKAPFNESAVSAHSRLASETSGPPVHGVGGLVAERSAGSTPDRLKPLGSIEELNTLERARKREQVGMVKELDRGAGGALNVSTLRNQERSVSKSPKPPQQFQQQIEQRDHHKVVGRKAAADMALGNPTSPTSQHLPEPVYHHHRQEPNTPVPTLGQKPLHPPPIPTAYFDDRPHLAMNNYENYPISGSVSPAEELKIYFEAPREEMHRGEVPGDVACVHTDHRSSQPMFYANTQPLQSVSPNFDRRQPPFEMLRGQAQFDAMWFNRFKPPLYRPPAHPVQIIDMQNVDILSENRRSQSHFFPETRISNNYMNLPPATTDKPVPTSPHHERYYSQNNPAPISEAQRYSYSNNRIQQQSYLRESQPNVERPPNSEVPLDSHPLDSRYNRQPSSEQNFTADAPSNFGVSNQSAPNRQKQEANVGVTVHTGAMDDTRRKRRDEEIARLEGRTELSAEEQERLVRLKIQRDFQDNALFGPPDPVSQQQPVDVGRTLEPYYENPAMMNRARGLSQGPPPGRQQPTQSAQPFQTPAVPSSQSAYDRLVNVSSNVPLSSQNGAIKPASARPIPNLSTKPRPPPTMPKPKPGTFNSGLFAQSTPQTVIANNGMDSGGRDSPAPPPLPPGPPPTEEELDAAIDSATASAKKSVSFGENPIANEYRYSVASSYDGSSQPTTPTSASPKVSDSVVTSRRFQGSSDRLIQ